MKRLIFSLLVFSGFSANAEIICRDYSANGDLNVTQICAQKNSDGTFSKPELVADNGNWQISKGFFTKKRANKVCRALGFDNATSYKTRLCLQEAMPTNLSGNYTTSNFPPMGTGKCISELTCK